MKEQLDHESKYFIGVDLAMGKDSSVRFKKHPDGRVEVLTNKKTIS